MTNNNKKTSAHPDFTTKKTKCTRDEVKRSHLKKSLSSYCLEPARCRGRRVVFLHFSYISCHGFTRPPVVLLLLLFPYTHLKSSVVCPLCRRWFSLQSLLLVSPQPAGLRVFFSENWANGVQFHISAFPVRHCQVVWHIPASAVMPVLFSEHFRYASLAPIVL